MGKTFDGLTKPGVSDGGKTKYYGNEGEAAQAMASDMSKYAQPSPSIINGNLGEVPDTVVPMAAPGPSAGDTIGTGFESPSIDPNSLPKMSTPPFVAPQDANRPLTTKGEVLRLLITGLTGAAAGLGRRSAGESAQAGAAIEQNADEAGQRGRASDLNAKLTQAHIDNLPVLAAIQKAELDRTQAQTTLDKAKAKRGEYMYTKNGILNLLPDGSTKIIPGTEPEGKDDQFEQRAKFIQEHPEYFKDETELSDFAKYGPHPPKDVNPNPTSLAVAAAKGDPVAQKALSLYGAATRPNYAASNDEAKHDRGAVDRGNAEIAASKFMNKAGNDPLKALQHIDSFVAANQLTPEQAGIIADARKSIQERYKATKPSAKKGGGNSPVDILQSILGQQQQPAEAAQ